MLIERYSNLRVVARLINLSARLRIGPGGREKGRNAIGREQWHSQFITRHSVFMLAESEEKHVEAVRRSLS